MSKFATIKEINLSTFLNAIPQALFIVDENNIILSMNKVAAQLTEADSRGTIKRMCGDILHCLYAQNAPEGCGTTPHCPDCVIRKTITESCSGQTIVKRKAELVTKKDKKESKTVFLISASPYVHDDSHLTILTLDDISEIIFLRSLLPICASCKKIRDDKGYWNKIEHYISEHSDTDFTHSICPECKNKLYPDL